MSFRKLILKNNLSKLKYRTDSLQSLQILFSRYRCDRSESVGEYPRKLKTILNPACWLCNYAKELIHYLLESCPGTL